VIKRGESVVMECRANGFPEPIIKWKKKNGQPRITMFSSHTYSRMSVSKYGALTIDRVEKSDADVYTCHAVSASGSTNASAKLEVKGSLNTSPPPIILYGLQNQTLPIQSTAVLFCNATGQPTPSISWLKDNKTLSMNKDKCQLSDDGTLKIMELHSNDSGRYTCMATNEMGEAQSSCYITVESPNNHRIIFKRTPDPFTYPGPPVRVQATEIKETSVKLVWRTNNYDGYSEITNFVVEYFSPDQGEGWVIASDGVTELSYVVRNLQPATSYLFLVRAQNSHGIGMPSHVTSLIKTKSILILITFSDPLSLFCTY
ncbi:hypothetical protein HELRODRAFT_72804, partial [Helobdella robusta]|uniref:Uncharacterized protein n=1 Tax=Helobdella robusta TaxID=6412 RepID=T1G159_HELRO